MSAIKNKLKLPAGTTYKLKILKVQQYIRSTKEKVPRFKQTFLISQITDFHQFLQPNDNN